MIRRRVPISTTYESNNNRAQRTEFSVISFVWRKNGRSWSEMSSLRPARRGGIAIQCGDKRHGRPSAVEQIARHLAKETERSTPPIRRAQKITERAQRLYQQQLKEKQSNRNVSHLSRSSSRWPLVRDNCPRVFSFRFFCLAHSLDPRAAAAAKQQTVARQTAQARSRNMENKLRAVCTVTVAISQLARFD